MSDESLSLLSSGLIRGIAAGTNEAFDRLLRQYNSQLVQRARFYLRRLQMYETFYESQEAVDDALAAMYDRARRGELLTIETSADFWREFFYQIRREIRRIGDYAKARKRNPKLGPARSDPDRGRDSRTREESMTTEMQSRLEVELDAFYSQLPSHEALSVMRMDVEVLFMSFSDPICREILKMRLENYSVEEIAEHCNLSVRTVRRRLQDIRAHYSALDAP
jgi:DNA-directed RNA polymerase specialized sigma24 family protein